MDIRNAVLLLILFGVSLGGIGVGGLPYGDGWVYAQVPGICAPNGSGEAWAPEVMKRVFQLQGGGYREVNPAELSQERGRLYSAGRWTGAEQYPLGNGPRLTQLPSHRAPVMEEGYPRLQRQAVSNGSMISSPHGNPYASQGVSQSPHGNPYAPHGVSSAPHSVSYAPHSVSSAPHSVSSAPHGVSPSPHGNPYAPHSVSSAPHSVSYAPHGVSSAPHGVSPSPHSIPPSPHGGSQDPRAGAMGDISGLQSVSSAGSGRGIPAQLTGYGVQADRDPPEDPLLQMGPDPKREQERQQKKGEGPPVAAAAAVDPHAEVFAETLYPSAIQCAKCHQRIYDEWRVSSHAYASVSPMFQRFEQAVSDLTRGTVGTFCMRCHAPVATQLGYPREASIFEGPQVFREGITCVACHRVTERYGRVNGERRIETGSIYDPVVGNSGGDGVARVVGSPDQYKVKLDANDKRPLQTMHRAAIQFDQLSDSSFCAGCHQVVVQPGIALEIVYQQYRAGPACKKGVSCQDCHMGLVPGKDSGYPSYPIAEIANKPIEPYKKHANHMFYGPMYPIAHPGIFPHNEKSLRWKAADWFVFDWRAGWGTEGFERWVIEQRIPKEQFPPAWQSSEERRDARKVVDSNLALIQVKRANAVAILENTSRIDGPFFTHQVRLGSDLKFEYQVSNLSDGHNMPSGSLGAQPQLWLNAVLIGPRGQRIWESGHLDKNGDLCDNHSLQVAAQEIPHDAQLVNFQTKFLYTNVKGTDREMYVPIPFDIDPIPFFRPGAVPYTVLNHPPFIRMEAHSIPPLGTRRAKFTVPRELLTEPGRYRLSVRMRSRVEPVYFLKFVGGTQEMERALNEGILDVHPYSSEFEIR